MTMQSIHGKPIINSKTPIVLKIMPCDIKGARQKNHGDCAIARALKREFHAKEVRVGRDRAYVRLNETDWMRYRLGRTLKHEMIVNDRGGVVEPGTYYLSPMGPAKSRGRQQGSSTNQKTGNGGPKRQGAKPIKNIRVGMTRAMRGQG